MVQFTQNEKTPFQIRYLPADLEPIFRQTKRIVFPWI